MYHYIFFDLDGTLTDSKEGILNSLRYAFDKLGEPVPPESTLIKFIGPPLYASFMDFYGLDRQKALEAVEFYREYYRDRGIWENEVYAGIPELLAKLKGAGKRLLVATSKPENFALQILEHFHLRQYFDRVAGSTLDSSRVEKADVICYALEQQGIAPGPSVVMVGDREHDVLGARKAGLDCIGVLFGYGDAPELQKAGAARIAATVEELAGLLLA